MKWKTINYFKYIDQGKTDEVILGQKDEVREPFILSQQSSCSENNKHCHLVLFKINTKDSINGVY